MPKYIFVTGGVVSSVGKGITTAALGRILKSRHISVSVQKLDPYLNVDPGTMSPYQHGEVFVTSDGAETDLDLGHYERFIDEDLTRASSLTMGQVYNAVIQKERRGDFLGGTIQAVPHLTAEIKARIRGIGRITGAQAVIIEVGGTVGDIEGQVFLEAIRQMRREEAPEDTLSIHVTYLPFIGATGEIKTKPTQHSVQELRRMGIQPDVILCRSDHPVTTETRDKIALFCDVERRAVVPVPTMRSIYEVPAMLEDCRPGRLRHRAHEDRCRAPRPCGLAPPRRPHDAPALQPQGRHRRQIRRAARRLSLGQRIADPRRALTTTRRSRSSGSTPNRSTRPTSLASYAASTPSSCPAASASAASRAKCWPRDSPARTRSPTWAFAWACRSWSSKRRGRCWVPTRPTRPSSTQKRPTP